MAFLWLFGGEENKGRETGVWSLEFGEAEVAEARFVRRKNEEWEFVKREEAGRSGDWSGRC
jgi:hypothetical protein